MADAQNIPGAIQWHEGMLLAPQHFQQWSARNEELLHYHLMCVAPFHWGVQLLKVDQALLIEGILRIQALEAVMPDGLVVHHQHTDDNGIEVDLTPFVEEMTAKPLSVHLVVPAKKTGMGSIKGSLARYDSVEGNPVPDENTGETEVAIPYLKPRLSLLVTENPPQKYTSFPLCRIAYRNEIYTMAHYMPPMLRVPTGSILGEICSTIARRLREKAVFMSEQLRSPSSAAQGPMVLETKALIQSMVAGLPHFEAILNTGVSHPYPLYLALCTLVGHTASLGLGLVPPVFAAYNHNDLVATFEQARDYVFKMIDEGVRESHTGVPFNFEDGVFSINLREGWIDRDMVIGVRGKQGVSERELMVWMNESLIGSSEFTESMKEKRILGPSRKRIDSDGELVPARGVLLYSVIAAPEFIQPETMLQIFNTSDPKHKRGPAEMILYVRKKA